MDRLLKAVVFVLGLAPGRGSAEDAAPSAEDDAGSACRTEVRAHVRWSEERPLASRLPVPARVSSRSAAERGPPDGRPGRGRSSSPRRRSSFDANLPRASRPRQGRLRRPLRRESHEHRQVVDHGPRPGSPSEGGTGRRSPCPATSLYAPRRQGPQVRSGSRFRRLESLRPRLHGHEPLPRPAGPGGGLPSAPASTSSARSRTATALHCAPERLAGDNGTASPRRRPQAPLRPSRSCTHARWRTWEVDDDPEYGGGAGVPLRERRPAEGHRVLASTTRTPAFLRGERA